MMIQSQEEACSATVSENTCVGELYVCRAFNIGIGHLKLFEPTTNPFFLWGKTFSIPAARWIAEIHPFITG